MIAIVPNVLRDEINKKLDEAYLQIPEAAVDRDHHFRMCLSYFDDNGVLPEFKIVKTERNDNEPE